MKRKISFVLFAALCIGACSNNRNTDSPIIYKADLGQSHIYWTINKFHGSALLSDGNFTIQGDRSIKGACNISLTTLKMDDVDSSTNRKIILNVLDAFLNAKQYPLIHFSFSEIKKMKQEGNFILGGILTVKGLTRNISFPVSTRCNNIVATLDGAAMLHPKDWMDYDGRADDSSGTLPVQVRFHIVANK